MTTIRLRSRNPLDPPSGDLEDLAEHIRDLDSSYDVQIESGEPPRVGVSMVEVVECYVPWTVVSAAALRILEALLIDWLRKRFEKVPERPKSVVIYGPDERVLETVSLSGPDEEPQIEVPDRG